MTLENLERIKLLLPLERSGTAKMFHIDSTRSELSIQSRLQLAYEASFASALAALRWHGYRPSSNRYVVFQALSHTIELGSEVALLIKAHAMRNEIEYDAEPFDDLKFLEELIAVNEILLDRVPRLQG
jgi:hypothetical protein